MIIGVHVKLSICVAINDSQIRKKRMSNSFFNIVFYCDSVSDVSDTILYLLLGTTEPAEIENAEVSFIKK